MKVAVIQSSLAWEDPKSNRNYLIFIKNQITFFHFPLAILSRLSNFITQSARPNLGLNGRSCRQ